MDRAEIIAALKPFAKEAESYDYGRYPGEVMVLIGDCRRARDVLAKLESRSK